MRDVESLDAIGVPAVIVGKAIYEGRISFDEIQRLNLTK
jgi:phosphoribosylformimino-5-aminoimidazole carboxamide ribotide isomerase